MLVYIVNVYFDYFDGRIVERKNNTFILTYLRTKIHIFHLTNHFEDSDDYEDVVDPAAFPGLEPGPLHHALYTMHMTSKSGISLASMWHIDG